MLDDAADLRRPHLPIKAAQRRVEVERVPFQIFKLVIDPSSRIRSADAEPRPGEVGEVRVEVAEHAERVKDGAVDRNASGVPRIGRAEGRQDKIRSFRHPPHRQCLTEIVLAPGIAEVGGAVVETGDAQGRVDDEESLPLWS